MLAPSPTRRPGIAFQTVAPVLPTALPRMDIAGFVGFAGQGPVNVPVPVESMERFLDVFGPPVDLVRDPETGQRVRSYLARSVDAFFRNGGRRCWIVRVADAPERRWFVVPGLVDARTGSPAVARARSLGSGFDDVRVGTVVRRRSMPSPRVWRSGSRWHLAWPTRPDGLDVGTMIRLARPGDPHLENAEVFLPVMSISSASGRTAEEESALPPGVSGTVADGDEPFAFRQTPGVSAPPGGWLARVALVDGTAALPDTAPGATTLVEENARIYVTPRGMRIAFETAVSLPDRGHVLHAEIDASHIELGDTRTLWATVDTARTIETGGRATTVVTIAEQRWPVDAETLISDETIVPSGGASDEPWITEQVSFDMLAWRGEDIQRRVTGLQLVDEAPEAWTKLPIDADLFQVEDGREITPLPDTLAARVFDERFPVAAPPRDPSTTSHAYVPFGMKSRPDPSGARPPTPVTESALRRNGLWTFSNDLFLDDRLTDATTDALRRRAPRHLLLPEEPDTKGLHALWAIPEVTLVALPDALHRGWVEREMETPTDIVPIPEDLTARPCENDASSLCVSWLPVELPLPDVPGTGLFGPIRYEVQESPTADFELGSRLYSGPDTHTERPITASCPASVYIRIRATTPTETGPWSETVRVVLPPSVFQSKSESLTAPVAELSDGAPGETLIRFERIPADTSGTSLPPGPTIEYEVQRAPDPAMERAETMASSQVVATGVRTFEVSIQREAEPVFLRVRAVLSATGRPGPWSRTVGVPPESQPNLLPVSAGEYDAPTSDTPNRGRNGLLDLQRAVLRFCAARGDVLAMLSLPAGDQTDDARKHLAKLTELGAAASDIGPLQIPSLRVSEEPALSYGAVYHPWPVVRSDEGIVADSPDGAACGIAARRALQRGAWIAPANVPLDRALALRPDLGPPGFDLLAARVNVLSLGPRGVQFEAASTLSPDPRLRPISTRRLLSLLLRLARREGPSLVFESNTLALRRDAAAVFDRLLLSLFEQGALAGQTAAEAYRVVTDGTVNTPETIERGQLIIEVRVAPAAPLEFILVRLVQRGGQITTTTERPVSSAML